MTPKIATTRLVLTLGIGIKKGLKFMNEVVTNEVVTVVTVDAVISNISSAIDELDGDDIAELHNTICSRKIRYVADNFFEYTGEDDSNV